LMHFNGKLRGVMNVPTFELWKATQVCRVIGIGRTGLYERVSAGTFPAPLKTGRLVRWRSDEVAEWMNTQARAVIHLAGHDPVATT
jgi:predicted DNA-binding transcriptional regulator AlpA